MNRATARADEDPAPSGEPIALLEPASGHPVLVEEPSSPARGALRRAVPILYAVWIAAIAALFFLHFPHLLADFPNRSPWMDYSKYTDEGWYSNAAVRYTLTGHWYLRGDFNPAVALPVWPVLLAGVFHFTGVSLAADRALALVFFGLNLFLAWRLVRTQAPRWAALLAVTLLATNPFLWAFSRLALLEPPLIFFLLLSWLLALRLPGASARARTGMLIAIGLLLCLMTLTKTTAIFFLPSTLFLVARAYGSRLRSLRALILTTLSAALPWCAYYFLLVRPHYRVDYQYLFDANHWPQPTTFTGWIAAFGWALHGSFWISATLSVTALALLALALIPPPPARSSALTLFPHLDEDPGSSPGLWRNPLLIASLIAAAGCIFFVGWHNNPQPRYYAPIAWPLCFILALGVADLLRRSRPGVLSTTLSTILRIACACALATLAAVSVAGAIQIARYLRHPEYTFVNAARSITQYIDAHPERHRLLLSISGDDIRLITGLPAICDDYGPWDLAYRIHNYRPGWYATWNELDNGTVADLSTQYSLQRVAAFSAFDDPDRDVLILYRMDLLPSARQTYAAHDEEVGNAGR